MNSILLIGIGNPYRGDDAIGLELTRALEAQLGSLVDVIYCTGNPLDLIESWGGREAVYLIDAVYSGAKEPGSLHRYLAHKESIPAIFSEASTHSLGIGQAIELAKTLGKCPEKLVFYGIEGKSFQIETEISSAVRDKLPALEKEIRRSICMK